MANSYALLKGERTIGTLAKRLFVIEGAGRSEAQRVAEAALLRANPHLADADGFRSGRVVIVPADTGLKTTDRVVEPKGGVGGALDDTSIRLKLASQLLEDQVESEAKSAEKTLEQLGDRNFVRALRKAVPDGAKLIPQTRKAIKGRAETAEELRKRYAKAFAMAEAEIERLQKLAKSQG